MIKDILISFVVALIIGCFMNSYNESNKNMDNFNGLNNDQTNYGSNNQPNNLPNQTDPPPVKSNVTGQNVYNNSNNPGSNPMLTR